MSPLMMGATWAWSVGWIALVLPFVLVGLFREHEQVQEIRQRLGKKWRFVRFLVRRVLRKWTRLTLQLSRPLLRLSQKVPYSELRNGLLLVLFVAVCFVPYALRPLSIKLAALVQILWSSALFGVGLSMAFMHFLVEQELDAIANGLLGRERNKRSEAPVAQYLSFDGLVDVGTLVVACIGMAVAFAFLVQGLFDLGLTSWYTVRGQHPTLGTWMLYTILSVFRALDIFDTFATFQVTVATVRHNGFLASLLVFLFKAVFDILLIAKLRDWWSKRSLARKALPALAYEETRDKAEETLRRCRKSAIPLLLDAYHTSHSVAVRCSVLVLLDEVGYRWRGSLYQEALASKEEDIRRTAAGLLGKTPTDAAIKALGQMLGDGSSEVRASVVEALAVPSHRLQVTPLLLRALTDDVADVREQAVHALAKLAPKEALDALVGALQDKEASVRKAAVAAISRFEPEIFVRLVPMYDDPNRDVRLEVVKAIASQLEAEPERASDFLTNRALNDEDADVRLAVVSELRWAQYVKAIPMLGLTLLADTSARVRQAVVEALGYMEHKDAIEWLPTALADKHYMVRCKAIEALGDLRAKKSIPQVVGLLKDNDRDVRKQATTTLGELGVKTPDVIQAVEAMLDDVEEQVRVAAAEALSELTNGQSPALAKALDDPHPAVRREGLFAIDSPIPDAFVDRVLGLACDINEEREVRSAAVDCLGFYDADNWPLIAEKAEPLLPVLLADGDVCIREKTVSAIGMTGFAGAHRLLLPLLQHEDRELRKEAATALTFIDAPEVVDGLVGALHDESLGVRVEAAEALAEQAERHDLPQAVRPLVTALREDDKAVGKFAALALAHIASQDAFQALLEALSHVHPEVRAAAAEACLIRNEERDANDPEVQRSTAMLRQMLQDEESDVGVAAAEALGKTNSPDNVAALCEALRRGRSDWVRFAAARSLVELKPQAANDALLASLIEDEDEWVRAAAAEALGEIQLPVSLPVLQAQLIAERKPAVREELVAALQHYNDEAANDAMAQALLQEQSPDVRRKLIDAFEELHLTRHVSVLKQALLREDVTSIRRRIHKVLKQLEPPVPFMAEDDPFEQTVKEVTDTSFGA